MQETTFTISALARLFGHDRRKVTRLLEHVEPVRRDGKLLRFTVRQYHEAWQADLLTEDGVLLDPAQERAALDRVRRALAEQEFRKREGELIEAAEAERLYGRMVAAFRNRALAVPEKGAAVVVGMDQYQASALLRDLVEECLEELSNWDPADEPAQEPTA